MSLEFDLENIEFESVVLTVPYSNNDFYTVEYDSVESDSGKLIFETVGASEATIVTAPNGYGIKSIDNTSDTFTLLDGIHKYVGLPFGVAVTEDDSANTLSFTQSNI